MFQYWFYSSSVWLIDHFFCLLLCLIPINKNVMLYLHWLLLFSFQFFCYPHFHHAVNGCVIVFSFALFISLIYKCHDMFALQTLMAHTSVFLLCFARWQVLRTQAPKSIYVYLYVCQLALLLYIWSHIYIQVCLYTYQCALLSCIWIYIYIYASMLNYHTFDLTCTFIYIYIYTF